MIRSFQWRNTPNSRNRGFTLVELLVVIAIIGVLVSLLLPAVQAAREAARRMTCQNNLKNLGLAILNFESSTENLPQSTDMGNPPGRVVNERVLVGYSGQQFSWIVRILPYLEQQPLYDRIDFTQDAFNQNTNAPPEQQQLESVICPSDQASGRFYSTTTGPKGSIVNGRVYAKGNYAAYACPEHITSSEVWPGALVNKPQPLSRVLDGTSNSIMLSEVRTRDELTDQRGAWFLAWTGSTVLGLDMHGSNAGTGNIAEQTTLDISYLPNPDLAPGSLPPNSPPGAENADEMLECNNPADADILGMPCISRSLTGLSSTAAPRSTHPGGVNGANIDGSVRFLFDEIDPLVLGLIVCINDELPITE